MRDSVALFLTTQVACLGFASAQGRASDERADSLRPLYAPILANPRVLVGLDTASLDSVPIDSIVLRHGPCFGLCPVYTAVLYRDGHARYTGGAHASPLGQKQGSVFPTAFARLGYLAQYLRFSALDSAYALPVTDMPTVWITVGWRDRAAETVRNYGDFGPPQLWAFQVAIEDVVKAIRWEPR